MEDNTQEIEGFRQVMGRYEEIYPNTAKILDLARHLKSLGHADVVVECVEVEIMRTYRPVSKFRFFELLDAFFCELNDRTLNDIFATNIPNVFASIYRTANGHQRQHMLSRLGGGAVTWYWSFTDAVIKRIHEAVRRVDPQYNSPWLTETQAPPQAASVSASRSGAAAMCAKSRKQAKKLDAFAQLGPTLRVSNLTQEVNRHTIRHHFAEYGQCVVNIPYSFDSVAGVAKSHGYALVRYEQWEEAERARQGLDGGELDGRRITVKHYGGSGPTAQASTPDRNDDTAQHQQDPGSQQEFRVYVHNLAPSVDNYRLRELFAKFDCCAKDTFVAWDKAWNRSRGYGCVVFNDMESAQRAVKAMDGADVAGRTISVNMDFKQLPTETTDLYVYNLGPDFSGKKLRELFEPFGEVLRACVPVDKATGQSCGYGFVTFAEADAARRARNEMDGAGVDGRMLDVELNYRQLGDSSFSVFVNGLAADVNRSKLRDAFAHLGVVRSVHAPTDPRTGNSRGFGFVFFEEHESARRAVCEMNGQYLRGRQVWVKWNERTTANGTSEEHNRSQPPAGNRPQLSQNASSAERHALTSSANASSEARPSRFLQSLMQAASTPSQSTAHSAQQETLAGANRFKPGNTTVTSTTASTPYDRAAQEHSEPPAVNAIEVTVPTSTPNTDSTTTPELQPVSGQPLKPKRPGYVSQRLHRMRFGDVPVAEPMLSPIREVLTSAPSSSAGSRESASNSQVARDEERAVGLVLPLPTAVRVRSMPNKVTFAEVNERYYLLPDGERSSLLVQLLSAQANFAQGSNLSRKTVVLVNDTSERDSTVLELFARVSNALASTEVDAVRSHADGLAVLVASVSDPEFSVDFLAEFSTIVFLFVPAEDVVESFVSCSKVGNLSVYIFGDSADAADVQRIRPITDVR